ncbi:hypothetical protein O4H49_00990 [Kiloniella laminariae]|uniref:Fe2OG dioxygenase domain-containing protein n=1 Tax=Kiloniella laminariae TaxID=454162 RepID=A0ABT4LEI0_9PROT|nr:hypothetical protein [Kiloniella laminariae]MCZ4279330.1 hypothetical protein [Kiloniella laminariae]
MPNFDSHLLTTPAVLAAEMARLPREGAVAFPLVDAEGCQKMLMATEGLSFRDGTPVVGSPGNEVTQDFRICMNFNEASALDDYQQSFEKQLNQAFQLMQPQPYPTPFSFNDRAVLHYSKGSTGISPHRDLVFFEAVIAILTLKGGAGFYICDDREKTNARRMNAEAGVMILMRGKNFAGLPDRPYHYVEGITRDRVGYGLRYNVREPEEKAR